MSPGRAAVYEDVIGAVVRQSQGSASNNNNRRARSQTLLLCWSRCVCGGEKMNVTGVQKCSLVRGDSHTIWHGYSHSKLLVLLRSVEV